MKKNTRQLIGLSLVLILLMAGKLSYAQEEVIVASSAKPAVRQEVIVTAGDKAAESVKEEDEEPAFSFSGSIDTYFHTTFKNQNAYYGDAYAPSTSFADQKGFGIGYG
jgi:hypothetical protein